jgi:transketolase
MRPIAGPPERSPDPTVSSPSNDAADAAGASSATLDWTAADSRAVDLIRILAMDAVQQAGSGHPGTAMSLAPAAYLLYQHVMRHDPADPGWRGRDRFVLSCGHSSLTLYLQLYLSGYGLTLDDLKRYRTWGSLTPGHPEHGLTPGVETTTGPLGQGLATRKASGEVLTALAGVLPELWGGSADLAGSNNTTMKGEPSFIPPEHQTAMFPGNYYGRTLHFGIREHGMGGILNGIALHGLTRPYGGTFLVFSDYMRPSVRLAALMGLPVTYVWTHDSIGLGEDGPTHQPVEHLAALRGIPGLDVVRPGDANETVVAWRTILEQPGRPAGLCLSRQNLPVLDRGETSQNGLASADAAARGGYILAEGTDSEPTVILIATGSEVQIALAARDILQGEGISTRVVSMPCVEWFTAQDASYQEEVLPPRIRARVCVEAGIAQPWHAFAGDFGECVSLEDFGASAAQARLYEEYGFTAEQVAAAARSSLGRLDANVRSEES